MIKVADITLGPALYNGTSLFTAQRLPTFSMSDVFVPPPSTLDFLRSKRGHNAGLFATRAIIVNSSSPLHLQTTGGEPDLAEKWFSSDEKKISPEVRAILVTLHDKGDFFRHQSAVEKLVALARSKKLSEPEQQHIATCLAINPILYGDKDRDNRVEAVTKILGAVLSNMTLQEKEAIVDHLLTDIGAPRADFQFLYNCQAVLEILFSIFYLNDAQKHRFYQIAKEARGTEKGNLLNHHWRRFSPEDLRDFFSFLEEKFYQGEKSDLRDVLLALETKDQEAFADRAEETLKGNDAEKKRRAIHALRLFPNPRVDPIVKAIDDPDPEFSKYMMRSLQDFADHLHQEALLDLLEKMKLRLSSEEADMRFRAFETIICFTGHLFGIPETEVERKKWIDLIASYWDDPFESIRLAVLNATQIASLSRDDAKIEAWYAHVRKSCQEDPSARIRAAAKKMMRDFLIE